MPCAEDHDVLRRPLLYRLKLLQDRVHRKVTILDRGGRPTAAPRVFLPQGAIISLHRRAHCSHIGVRWILRVTRLRGATHVAAAQRRRATASLVGKLRRRSGEGARRTDVQQE